MDQQGPLDVGAQLRALAVDAEAVAAKCNRQQLMLDKTMDLHNDLVDWACSTDHAGAAAEITAILDKYFVTKRDSTVAVVIPNQLTRSTT